MPSLYVIAGPNGAGKTTFIKRFAPRELALLDFINADEIARGLAPLAPERELLEAGRLVLERFRRFVDERRDFCLFDAASSMGEGLPFGCSTGRATRGLQ